MMERTMTTFVLAADAGRARALSEIEDLVSPNARLASSELQSDKTGVVSARDASVASPTSILTQQMLHALRSALPATSTLGAASRSSTN